VQLEQVPAIRSRLDFDNLLGALAALNFTGVVSKGIPRFASE